MQLYFITGNKKKFKEVNALLPEVEQLNIDVPEIQGTDAHVIIKKKLETARRHKKARFIVEDTSLYMDCLGGLPGPLIKWFLKSVGNDGLANLAKKLGNPSAQAKTIIGYSRADGRTKFVEGVLKGEIVSPRGDSDFGWDPIFQPEGHEKTFAQMTKKEKNEISMRRHALNKLKKVL
jgi:inosine triphosphate pyrophosphatase